MCYSLHATEKKDMQKMVKNAVHVISSLSLDMVERPTSLKSIHLNIFNLQCRKSVM